MNSSTVPSALHRSRVPLYLQVAKLMRQKIERLEWAFGTQIPTLDHLERDYGVSRITLRAALNQLEQEGVVRRTRGRGTFVAKDLSAQRWFKLPNTLEELVATVASLHIRLLHIEQAPRPLVPAFPFGKVGPAYHRLRRVHYHENVPYCLIDIYLDQAIFESDPQAFQSATVVPQLAVRPDIDIAGARQVMRITVSDEETAAHLDIGVSDPIADVCRALVDQYDRIVYYAHIQYPAQMIQIETDLIPPPRRRAKRPRAR